MFTRHKTKMIHIGNIAVGGKAGVSIQSMCNTDTKDVAKTLAQIQQLKDAGCDIVRLAVVDKQAAKALKLIKEQTDIALVADIHFDYKLALAAIMAGADGLRINPGNIGSQDKIRQVVQMAAEYGVPIRIGVNSGSVEKQLLEKHGGPTVEALVESAIHSVRILEDQDFYDIKISIKSSDVMTMIETNRILAKRCNYPLHLGVTEAGLIKDASIKSAIGIGTLLAEGIGDTIRVSVTDDPVREIEIARSILNALNLRNDQPTLISCPTCGRTEIDLIPLASQVKKIIDDINKPITVAVMGCAVNGPGEAREADIGIAGGKNQGLIFRKGKIIKKVGRDQLLSAFKEELQLLLKEME